MSHSLEASLVFNDALAANETLATRVNRASLPWLRLLTRIKAVCLLVRNPEENNDTLGALVSRWLFPDPVAQPIMHNGNAIGEIRLTARDNLISHFIWLSFAVLTGCILLPPPSRLRLHNLCIMAWSRRCKTSPMSHDVRTNRNFSRRVKDGRIEEFHQFGEDFNSLLDEMEEWQLKLQAKNAQLLRTAMHDPLTGLANRAAFRSSIAALMHDASAKPTLPCSSSTVIISSLLTIRGHAAGDCVLIEVARRMVEFGDKRHQSYRLGGDELRWCCTACSLPQRFNRFVLRCRSSLCARSICITGKQQRCHLALALLWRGKVPLWKHYWSKPTATCTG